MSAHDRPSSRLESPTATPDWTVATWVVGVPAVILLGFLALLGRAGVGIQIAGLPLGALLTPVPTLLFVVLLVLPRGRRLLATFSTAERRIAILVGVAVIAGTARAAAQGMPTLLLFHLPEDYDPVERRRLRVKPALTGSWQIVGRSSLNSEQPIQNNLPYVKNWSLLGDVVILICIVRAVLSRRGAL